MQILLRKKYWGAAHLKKAFRKAILKNAEFIETFLNLVFPKKVGFKNIR